MLLDFIAAISFYGVPYLTGRIFTKKPVLSFLLGALIWFLILFVLSFAKLVNFPIILSIVLALLLISSFRIGIELKEKSFKINPKELITVGSLVLFCAFVYFFIWKRNTPYPLSLNWDIYEHITAASLISKGQIALASSKISDTFTFASYTPIFATMLSIPKIIFSKSLIGIYFWLEFLHLCLTTLAVFLVSQKLFQKREISVFAAAASALIFESVVAYTSFFLIPQTLVALVCVLVILEIHQYKKWEAAIVFAVIFLMHFVLGIVAIAILSFIYLATRYKIKERILNISIVVSSIFALVLVLLNNFGSWQITNREEALHFNFDISQKIGFLTDWSGIFVAVFGILGAMFIFRKGTYAQKLFLIVALIAFGISFAPFSYFLKFFVLGHYFVIFVVVASVYFLTTNFSKEVKYTLLCFLLFVLLLTFYKNQLVYKEPLHFKTYETQVSFAEIKTGEYLLSLSKSSNVFLVSDPSSQYILEAISGVNTQGGAYMDEDTRKILSDINGSSDSDFIKTKLMSIKDLVTGRPTKNTKVLFAVGGRYFAWQNFSSEQKMSTFYNIWSPIEMNSTDLNYVNFLLQSPNFKLIYENNEIAIFKVL